MTSEQQQRVLIVDDDADIRLLLATALRQKSIDIDEAIDGHQAISMLREGSYSVVLLDLMMPGMDGLGVLDAIRNDPTPPVVLVITGASRGLIDKVDTNRVHGIIRKPFDPIEVAAIVASCADVRSRGGFEAMAVATVLSGSALIAYLAR